MINTRLIRTMEGLIPTWEFTVDHPLALDGERPIRYLVFGMRYPSDAVSKSIHETAGAIALEQFDGKVTLLRTCADDYTDWQILGIDFADGDFLRAVDWWPGEPIELDETVARMVIERRLSVGISVEGQPARVLANYGPLGVKLKRGGVLEPVASTEGGDDA